MLEVAQVAKDALLELLDVADGASKSQESEGERADNVRAGDVVEATPLDASDRAARRQLKAPHSAVLVGLGRVELRRRDGEEELEAVHDVDGGGLSQLGRVRLFVARGAREGRRRVQTVG